MVDGPRSPPLFDDQETAEGKGSEVKVLCCGVSGVSLFLELQEGKERMWLKPHSTELGSTTACTVRLVEGAGMSTFTHSLVLTLSSCLVSSCCCGHTF